MATAERGEAPEPAGGGMAQVSPPEVPVEPAHVPAEEPLPRLPKWVVLLVLAVTGTAVAATTAVVVSVLNPDLAAMPPVFRRPFEPAAEVSGPAVGSDPASPAASASAVATAPAPSPSQPTSPGAPPPPLLLSYEAEAAKRDGAGVRRVSSASGGSVVDGLDRPGDYVEFAVTVPTAGTYRLTVYYICEPDTCRAATTVNGGGWTTRSFPSTGDRRAVGSTALSLGLAAGGNTIRFVPAGGPAPGLDRITVTR